MALFVSVASGSNRISDQSSGIDLTRLDTSVRPQDDLYRYVNGDWLAATEIPADRVYYDAFIALADKVELDLRELREHLAIFEAGKKLRAR